MKMLGAGMIGRDRNNERTELLIIRLRGNFNLLPITDSTPKATKLTIFKDIRFVLLA